LRLCELTTLALTSGAVFFDECQYDPVEGFWLLDIHQMPGIGQ
jgi:hypothetical protein